MADGKIYITITDEPLSKPTPDTPTPTPVPKPEKVVKSDTELFTDFAKHQMFEFIKSQAQQFINYTIGNIGNFTGNYQTQRQINETMRVGGMLANVGFSALAGSKYGGVPGAIIGAAISIASQSINLAYENKSLDVQINKQNREIDMMRKISGLDPLTNMSRWG